MWDARPALVVVTLAEVVVCGGEFNGGTGETGGRGCC